MKRLSRPADQSCEFAGEIFDGHLFMLVAEVFRAIDPAAFRSGEHHPQKSAAAELVLCVTDVCVLRTDLTGILRIARGLRSKDRQIDVEEVIRGGRDGGVVLVMRETDERFDTQNDLRIDLKVMRHATHIEDTLFFVVPTTRIVNDVMKDDCEEDNMGIFFREKVAYPVKVQEALHDVPERVVVPSFLHVARENLTDRYLILHPALCAETKAIGDEVREQDLELRRVNNHDLLPRWSVKERCFQATSKKNRDKSYHATPKTRSTFAIRAARTFSSSSLRMTAIFFTTSITKAGSFLFPR